MLLVNICRSKIRRQVHIQLTFFLIKMYSLLHIISSWTEQTKTKLIEEWLPLKHLKLYNEYLNVSAFLSFPQKHFDASKLHIYCCGIYAELRERTALRLMCLFEMSDLAARK